MSVHCRPERSTSTVLVDRLRGSYRIHSMMKNEAPKQNWFPTLNAALESENLLESWDCFSRGIGYGETRSYTWADGSRHGHYVSIYRDERGMYERPVHYTR